MAAIIKYKWSFSYIIYIKLYLSTCLYIGKKNPNISYFQLGVNVHETIKSKVEMKKKKNFLLTECMFLLLCIS